MKLHGEDAWGGIGCAFRCTGVAAVKRVVATRLTRAQLRDEPRVPPSTAPRTSIAPRPSPASRHWTFGSIRHSRRDATF